MKKKLILLMITMIIVTCCACSKKDVTPSDELTPSLTETAEDEKNEPSVTEAVITEPVKEQPKEESIKQNLDEFGKIDGTTYSNSALKFSITFPDSFLLSDVNQIYKYLSETMEAKEEELKEIFKNQGISFLLLASDTQLGSTDRKDTLLLQSISADILGSLSEEQMVDSMVALFQQQIEKNGAKVTIEEPQKYTADNQNYYVMYARYEQINPKTNETVTQDTSYILFLRENELTYANLVGESEEVKTLTKQIADSLDFSL